MTPASALACAIAVDEMAELDAPAGLLSGIAQQGRGLGAVGACGLALGDQRLVVRAQRGGLTRCSAS